MGSRRTRPPTPPPGPPGPPGPEGSQRVWRNGWGMSMAVLSLAPPNPDGSPPAAQGIRIWFEPPRHGWLFPHVELVGLGEFVCRASHVEGNFVADLVAALLGVLRTGAPTRAEAFGEPLSFDFRFTRDPATGDVACDVVGYNKFASPVEEERVLALQAVGDGVCRAFCFGIRELGRGDFAGYGHPFPADELRELCGVLGGEFAGDG